MNAPSPFRSTQAVTRRTGESLSSGIIVGLLFAATVALFWSGFSPNDSDKYVRAALAWLANGPALGDDHWALRLPIVAPVAASFAVFGVSEFAATLPNILYAGGLVAVTFIFARRHLGKASGTAAAIIVATSSFLVVTQIELTVVGPEVFFLALGCWLFIEGAGEKTDLRLLFLSGLCAGAAWLCREIAIFLPAALTLVLLMRRPFNAGTVRAVVAIGAGFAAVLVAELGAYWLAAGDPLYRLHIDFGHRGPSGFYALPDGAPKDSILRRLTLPFKYLHSAPAITPFIAIGALVWLAPDMRRAALSGNRRTVTLVFAIASVMSFIVSAYVANVKAPIYYPIASYAALLSIGAFAGSLRDSGRSKAALALLASVVTLNWATADFRRYDEYAEPRYLASFVETSGETVTTDHRTAVRTRLYLGLVGMDRDEAGRRVLSANSHPLCGLIYSATPRGATPAITPLPGWRLLWAKTVRNDRVTMKLVKTFSAGGEIPPSLRGRLKIAGPVALYQAPPCP